MTNCICANRDLVASCVHPYCPAHVPPEMEEELASLRSELASAKAALDKSKGLAKFLRSELEAIATHMCMMNEPCMGDAWPATSEQLIDAIRRGEGADTAPPVASEQEARIAAHEEAIEAIYEHANPDGWCDTMRIVEAIRELRQEQKS